jgi:hypothetical protein
MKDIDFDELDRAVNSLVGSKAQDIMQSSASVSTGSTSVEPAAVAPTGMASAMSVDANPVNNTQPDMAISASAIQPASTDLATQPVAAQTDEQSQSPVIQQSFQAPLQTVQRTTVQPQQVTKLIAVPYPPRPRPLVTTPIAPAKPIAVNTFESLASKRGTGRFVDVVNPVTAKPLDQSNRYAPRIQSINQAPPVAVAAPSTIEPQPIIAAPVPVTQTAAPSMSADDDEDIDQINNFIDSTMGLSKKPQDSTLFNDTKVEKRPLGAFSGGSSQPVRPAEQLSVMQANNSVNPQLPPELQNDLLSIESDTMPEAKEDKTIEIPAIPMNGPAAIQSTPIAPTPPPSNIVPVAQTTSIDTMTKAQAQTPVATSINQQYQEKPSSVPQATTPIYDANAYHKLDKKGGKKGGLKWLFWVLGLIVVGAAVGAVVFFFVLPK